MAINALGLTEGPPRAAVLGQPERGGTRDRAAWKVANMNLLLRALQNNRGVSLIQVGAPPAHYVRNKMSPRDGWPRDIVQVDAAGALNPQAARGIKDKLQRFDEHCGRGEDGRRQGVVLVVKADYDNPLGLGAELVVEQISDMIADPNGAMVLTVGTGEFTGRTPALVREFTTFVMNDSGLIAPSSNPLARPSAGI